MAHLEAAGEAIHRAESAVGHEDWAGAWGPGQVAQYIAKRGFLPGEDGPWIDEIRQRLEAIYLRSLEARLRVILRDELGTVPGSATQDVHRRLLG